MLLTDFIIFVLSLWVGFEVISKVPATLHTPLMSAANSIHGIVLAGGIVIAATAHNVVGYILAFVAVAFAAMNVVGGYVVTGRMLKMFKRRSTACRRPGGRAERERPRSRATSPAPRAERQDRVMTGTFNTVIQLIYLAAASCFVLGLHLMNNPATARRGNQVSIAGMVAAIVATVVLVIHLGVITATGWIVIVAGILVGGGARPVLGQDREDDRDAAAGQHLQRGRRRRGRPGRDQGLHVDRRAASAPRSRSRPCST